MQFGKLHLCVLLLESSNSGERSADKTRLLTPAGLMTVAVKGAPAMTAGVAVTPSTVPRRAGVSDTNRGRREVVGVAGDDSRAVVVVAGNGGAPAAAAAAVEATLTMAAVLGT